MNPVERTLRSVDGWQQRKEPPGFIFGVIKKYGDDRGGFLAVQLTYYGFTALFPMLLVLTTILGFIGNKSIENTLVGTTLAQFPVLGTQIGHTSHPLSGSVLGLAVGLVGMIYGALGLPQAAQFAMAQVWNVPGVARPGYLPRMARSGLLFVAFGVAIIVTAGVSGLATLSGHGFVFGVLFIVVGAAVDVGAYVIIFRITTPKDIETSDLIPGAILGGIGYAILLNVGTALVQHQLKHAQAVYGQFALVIGLISWLYFVSRVTLYAAEFNVVRKRRLWPRSILQPPLTEADQRVLHDIARQEERRPEQRIGVGFEDHAAEEAGRDAAVDAGESIRE